jgi:c-di-GMP-related signal transduction protein
MAAIKGAQSEPGASLVFGQRRPLIDKTGQVAAFELRLPLALERRVEALDKSGAVAAQVANFLALLAATRGLQTAGRPVLVSLPAAVLARPGVADQVANGSLLLPQGGAVDAAQVTALRGRGVLLGVQDGPPGQAPDADFVLLQAAAGGLDTLQLSAMRWQKARPRLRTVALGLEGVDDVEQALASGLWLAGGRLGAVQQAPTAKPLQAAAHRICALLSDLAQDRDAAVVAQAVRGDAALAYRLLRYVNSAAIGLPRGVESVDDAVALLGRNELVRWLQVMLMSAAGGRQASAAVQEDALARGRLLETLARQRGVEQPGVLFTLGLMSRLDLLLQTPLAAALEPLRLSDDLLQALLHQQGPWSGYLALADELEGEDEAALGRLAQPFGGMAAVLGEAEGAWRWAAEVTGVVRPA